MPIIKAIIIAVLLLLGLSLMIGCKTCSPLIKEMDATYSLTSSSSLDDTYNLTSSPTLRANHRVTEVINKKFPSGTKVTDALNVLKTSGFKIYEQKRNGYRLWGNSEKIRQYEREELSKRIYNTYADNQTNYYANFGFWANLIEYKSVVIEIKSHDGEITTSNAAIYSHTL